MARQEVIDALCVVLADTQALYLKTQNYHWNVEGREFKSIHELLEDQYKDLADAVDKIAESIRMLGAKAPGTWQAYDKIRTIADGQESNDDRAMLQDLTNDQDKIAKCLQHGVKVAQEMGDEVIADLLIGRLAVHRQNHWMLSSTLK